MSWYKTGSVSITNGQTSVTATGTKFATNARVGDGFRAPDGEWYEVTNIASETVIAIFPAYAGVTVSNSTNYMIAPLQGYNKESADRLRAVTDSIRDFSDDVAAAAESAAAASASEHNAKTSENNAKSSELAAKTSETNAKDSENAADVSEANALASADRADTAADDALASQNAAADSAAAALVSQTAAKTSENAAKLSETNSKTSETNSKASENASKTSETNSKTSETNAAASASTASTAATTAVNAATSANASANRSEQARDDAIAAAATVTGNLMDMGPADLSSNTYPLKPAVSSFWKVVAGGVCTDAGETIEYGAGDTLVWSKPMNVFYKIDNTESVSSVAGKKGVVLLDKNDVGLPLVDNTSDVNKPVSTAQRAALDLKVDDADIVDNLASVDPTKVLSAKQGKVLFDLVQSTSNTLAVYEYVATLGQTVFTGADIHGKTMIFTPGPGTIVFQNGVQLQITVDYALSGTDTVTIVKPVEQAGDVIQVQAFGTFTVADHYTRAEDDVLLAAKADKTVTYTKTETDTLITGVRPHVGKIDWEPNRAMIPSGGLALDGLLYSRATYPDLWNLINTAKLPVIAEATWQSDPTQRGYFTIGTDGTNFRVPDYNGKSAGSLGAVFRRGDGLLSSTAGVIQRDAFQGHKIDFNGARMAAAAGTNYAGIAAGPDSGNMEPATGSAGFRLGVSTLSSDGTNGTPRTATETRPLNISGVWFIYAFGSVNNAGSLDASTLAANQASQASRIGVLEASEKKAYVFASLLPAWVNPTGPARMYWDTASIMTGGITYDGNGTNNWFILPTAGVYRITISALPQGSGTSIVLGWEKSGVITKPTQCYGNTALQTISLTFIGRFSANDKVWGILNSGTLYYGGAGSDGNTQHSITIERIDN